MKKSLNILLKCWLVWSCIFLIGGIGTIIRFAVGESPRLFQRDFSTILQIISCLFVFPIAGLEFCIFARKHNIPFWFLFSLILFGVEFAIGIFEVCVGYDWMVRLAWGIAMWYSLGVMIFTAISYALIKLSETADERKESQQRKESKNKQKLCEKLLSTAGKRFFVKYYDYLRSWNESDILDIIEENYLEKDKRDRIEASQKIFEKNLEQIALKIISGGSKIDGETVSIAKKLMESD